MDSTSDNEQVVLVPAEVDRSSGGVGVDERRDFPRIEVSLATHLACPSSVDALACTLADISEAGVRVHVAGDCGLAVGQRFEVTINSADHDNHLAHLIEDGCYATVVRTASCQRAPAGQISAGLRFDQPLMP